MIPLSLAEVRQWARALSDFDGALATVKFDLDKLLALRVQASTWPAALRTEHAGLLHRGRVVYGRLLSLKATRDTVRAWLAKVTAVVKGAVGLGQLGVLPLIYVGAGVAVFIAAIVAARSFIADTQGFARRYRLLNETSAKLIAQGVPPAEAYARAAEVAARAAGEADAPGFIEKFGMRALLIAGIIAGLYFVLPKLLPAARRSAAD